MNDVGGVKGRRTCTWALGGVELYSIRNFGRIFERHLTLRLRQPVESYYSYLPYSLFCWRHNLKIKSGTLS